MSYMKNLVIDRMNAEADAVPAFNEAPPDPTCCPICYRRYWAMVESGELDPDAALPEPEVADAD